VERYDEESGQRVLAAFNTSNTPIKRVFGTETGTKSLVSLAGDCPATPAAPGSISLTLPAFGWAICELGDK